ncbi:hypothetical protein QVD17_29968 [Tagetes erecta]|uniref:Uncharacterized protein n=1 Tax=Tagetes erecta TaxID=13708 RepID=A0AAD8NMV7_TARER|nr:hypothetical protein QVD17_29968 [Tagetes erecta]
MSVSERFSKKSDRGKKNRSSTDSSGMTSRHTGGSIGYDEHRMRLFERRVNEQVQQQVSKQVQQKVSEQVQQQVADLERRMQEKMQHQMDLLLSKIRNPP